MLLSLAAVIMKTCLHIYIKVYCKSACHLLCYLLISNQVGNMQRQVVVFHSGIWVWPMYLFTLGFEFAQTAFHSGIWVCPYIFLLWGLSLCIHLFALGSEFAHRSFHSGVRVYTYIFSLWGLSLPIHLFTVGSEFAHPSFHCGVWVCPSIFSLWGLSLPIHLFTLGFEFAHTSFHSGIWVCPYIFSLWNLSLPIPLFADVSEDELCNYSLCIIGPLCNEKKKIQIKLLKCNGRLGGLNFCVERKTVPDCTHFDEGKWKRKFTCQEEHTHTKKVEGGCGGWVSETDTEKVSDSTHPSPSAQLFPSKSTTTSSIGNLHF